MFEKLRPGVRVRSAVFAAIASTFSVWTSLSHGQEAQAVTIVLPQVPASVDPCETTASFVARVIKNNVVEGLAELNIVDNSVVPRLASGWEQLDASTWRFKLREGVTFHDGAPFDANAVVRSIERTMDPELSCRVRGKYFAEIKFDMKVVDPHTLDISTTPAQPILPMLMTHMMIATPNISKTEKTKLTVGTGPYTMQTWDPNQNIVLIRADKYWGDKPAVEKATYVWRTDSTVSAAMVATGEADIAYEIPPQEATNADTDFSFLNFETVRIRIGMNKAPLNDLRVRKALKLAANRDAFIGTILPADTRPATQLVVPTVLGYNPDLKLWSYDLEQARKLIAEAKADGVPVDAEIRLLTRNNLFPNSTEVLEGLTQMWAEAGLNVKILVVEAAQKTILDARPYAEDRPPTLSADQHDNASGDASLTFPYKYSSWGTQSDMEGHPELDVLINRAVEASGEERSKLFQQAFAAVADDIVPDVVLFHMVGYSRFGPRIEFPRELMTSNELQLSRIKVVQ